VKKSGRLKDKPAIEVEVGDTQPTLVLASRKSVAYGRPRA